MIHYDRVWAEIDLDAIIKNMESIKSRIDKNAWWSREYGRREKDGL